MQLPEVGSFFKSSLAESHLASIAKRREKSFVVNRVQSRDFAREVFADMLKTAWPVDTDISAADVLGVSKRQVQNWLKGDSSPAFEHVVAVGTVLGIYKTMEICTMGQTRSTVAKWIGQR